MADKGEFSQTSKSKSEEKIDIEPERTKPHNGKKITNLMLSPDSKYVATWSKYDNSICGWELDDDQLVKQSTKKSVEQSKNELNQFKRFGSISIGDFSKLYTVSNNKLVAILDTKRERIEVIDLEKKKKINLNLYQYRDWSMEECMFYTDEDNNESSYIVAHDYECQYIFKFLCNKNSQSWKIDNSISCGAINDIKKCHIDREKIMLIDNCRTLTQWNLSTLLLEKQYQLGWEIRSEYECRFIFNKNSTLLAVCMYYYPEGFIYVFLTENSLLLSKCKFEAEELQRLEFISFGQEEKLLLFFDKDNFEIRDPYDLEQVIHKDYFKSEVNNNEKIIKAFLKSGSNINDWNFVGSIKLKDEFYEKRDEIWGGIIIDIYGCDLLYNENLAMITSAGLFIWSIWPKHENEKIRLRYYISYKHEYMEKLDFKHVLEMILKCEKKFLLPAPDFEFFINNYKEKHTEDGRCLFAELLDDYIEDKILIKSYGQELLMCFLKSKNYLLIGKLCSKIYKETENHNILERFQLLDIFTLLFTELTHFPQLLKEFLSYTLFIHSTDYPEEIKFCKFFSEPHLQRPKERVEKSTAVSDF
ncbi:16734_t:CDS:2 [Gigaspora rosea]|nr:16734_t:CDS:2 [Gigaspora rosea]